MTAFWNDEGVTIQSKRPGFHAFRVDGYGAPSYPELVLCATRSTLRENPALAHGVVRALFDHYCAHPEEIPDSIPPGDLARRVTDYLAGMTDRYCVRAFEELSVPVSFAP